MGRSSGWDTVSKASSHKTTEERASVTFNQDDNVGGSSSRVFFFYFHLLKCDTKQTVSSGWMVDQSLSENVFCRPFLFGDGDYSVMNKAG